MTHSGLETALEDGTSRREIVPVLTDPSQFLTTASFSFDGSRVTYGQCTITNGSSTCEVKIVRLDTLETKTIAHGQRIASPHFTPDGSGVVYFELAWPPGPTEQLLIRLVDVATGVTSTLVEPVHPSSIELDLCVARDD